VKAKRIGGEREDDFTDITLLEMYKSPISNQKKKGQLELTILKA
jgi:hypothetical protein